MSSRSNRSEQRKNPLPPHIPGKIVDPIPKGDPGGPHTPGAKAKRAKEKAAEAEKEKE